MWHDLVPQPARGAHARPAPAAATARRAAREIGLLTLVAVVTWATVRFPSLFDWIPFAVEDQDLWAWLPVIGAVLVVLARLRWPASAVVGAAALFGWWPASGVALAVTAFEVTRFGSAKRRTAVLGVAGATGLGIGVLSTPQPILVLAQLHLATAVACLVLPAYIRILLGKVLRVQRALRERALYLEENYRLARSGARLAERSRIAQEMHDQLGHRLSLISMYAGALELKSTSGDPSGGAEAKLIRSTAQIAMHELRTILGLLRSRERSRGAPLRPVTETGSQSDIARLVSQSQAAGVDVHLQWRGDDLGDAPSLVRSAVHRIVREGLTNVHRHAAGAAATVVVERSSDAVRVQVANGTVRAPASGRGALPPGSGLGLVGVRERASLLGGEFCAGRLPGGGFQVTVNLPLSASAEAVRTPPSDQVTGDAGCDPPTVVLRAAGRQALSADRWVRFGSTTVLTVGLVGIAALVPVAMDYMPWYGYVPPDDESSAVLEARIGMSREETLKVIGDDDPVARLAARSVKSPQPLGGACVYDQQWPDDGEVIVLRYCFRADRLVSIDRIKIDGVGVAGQ